MGFGCKRVFVEVGKKWASRIVPEAAAMARDEIAALEMVAMGKKKKARKVRKKIRAAYPGMPRRAVWALVEGLVEALRSGIPVEDVGRDDSSEDVTL